jgi:hypothetical protein
MLREFVQTKTARSAPQIFFLLGAGPLRVAARALPMLETIFHNLGIGEQQARVARPQKYDQVPMLMPKFQSHAGTANENKVKRRTNPPSGPATMRSCVELIELFPRFFKTRMCKWRRYSQRAFDRRDIGTEALPEHCR